MSQQLKFDRQTPKTWRAAKAILSVDRTGWAWRGQCDAAWSLSTSLERACRTISRPKVEKILCKSFSRRAHHYLSAPHLPPDRVLDLDWLALMQHHGAPTRLLDWTYSPYVAAFFALDGAGSSNAAVWAVDIEWCRARAKRTLETKNLRNLVPGDNIWDRDPFRKIFIEHPVPLVLPAETHRTNERMTLQQGLFLCPGDVDQTFEQNLLAMGDPDELEKHLVKIVLPKRARVEALVDLKYMNLSHASLYPGIDGFARSLQQTIVEMEDPGRRERRRRYFNENKRDGQA